MQENKVTIVGAGVPGLTTAILLSQMGCKVTLVEARKVPIKADVKPTTRTAAIWGSGIDTLKATGVWDDLETYATPLKGLRIADDSQFPRGKDSIVEQIFEASDINEDVFGYNIPLLPMVACLGDMVRGIDKITLIENAEIDENHAVFKDCDLIIGADGRKSMVRQMAGITAHEKRYDQGVITCVVSHDQSHNNISTEFHRSGGPFTLVPHGDGQCAIVWAEDHNKIDEFMALPKESFLHAVQERSRGLLGQLNLVVSPESCPLITLYTDRVTAPKIALMAEAAHVMSPIGAQGLNLSLRDVQSLCSTVKNALLLGQDIGSEIVLSGYEKDRKQDIMTRVKGIDYFHRLVANDSPLIAKARRFGLKSVGVITPLRELLMEQGLRKSA